jgi:hypothetical protein
MKRCCLCSREIKPEESCYRNKAGNRACVQCVKDLDDRINGQPKVPA